MKTLVRGRIWYLLIILNFIGIGHSNAQCNGVNVVSPCGYTAYIAVNAVQVIPSSMSCAFGYNYNITFTYSITVVGTNTCSSGTIGFQPQIFCNSGQNNGYYTISETIPSGNFNTSYTGTLTTTTNPFTSRTDCAVINPTSLGCNSTQFTIFGPGINSTTYPCTSTLPITLRAFTATLQDNTVILNWTTGTEKNNDYFTLERTRDGDNWEVIAQLKGAGNSSGEKHYQFADRKFSTGLNYYRLKQTDFDGVFKNSEIVFINTLNDDFIRVFPNPAKDVLNIENTGDYLKDLVLINNLNQTIIREQIGNDFQLDLGSLPQGIYFLKIRSVAGENNYKIIKE